VAIKRLSVQNFKSFEKLDIDLGKFNVFIGSNASGKSNFIQIFKFINDIKNHGLLNAISLQGGPEYLMNMNISASKNLELSITSEAESGFVVSSKRGPIGIRNKESTYEFSLNFSGNKDDFKIVNDQLVQKCEFYTLVESKGQYKEDKLLGEGRIRIFRDGRRMRYRINKPSKLVLNREALIYRFAQKTKLPAKALFLQRPAVPFLMKLRDLFPDFSIYDLDPKLPKKASPLTGKAELEEDGSNLALVLRNILKNDNSRKTFLNLIKDLLPFIEDLDVERFADKSFMFKLQEKYFKNQYLPASLISDGTINITGLIVAMYFNRRSFVIIEEPERNIHPYLIERATNMMKDASKKRQILVTTHHPEIVRHTGHDDIFLVTRCEKGYSTVSKPANQKEVIAFLENEIGIDELFVQNLLGL